MLYVVRCRFRGTPTEEAEWNAWYSGPKKADMLRMPHFRSGHRFRSREDHPTYLALWVVDGPEAFETDRYQSRWGFKEWTGKVTDWSRDLVEPVRGELEGVDLDSPLTVAATDDARDDARATLWCRNVGLDRTWEWLAAGRPGAVEPAAPLWTSTFDPLTNDERRPA